MIFSGLKGIAFPLIVGVTGVSAGGGFSLASYLSSNANSVTSEKDLDLSQPEIKSLGSGTLEGSPDVISGIFGKDVQKGVKDLGVEIDFPDQRVTEEQKEERRSNDSLTSSENERLVAEVIHDEGRSYGITCKEWKGEESEGKSLDGTVCLGKVNEELGGIGESKTTLWLRAEQSKAAKILGEYISLREEDYSLINKDQRESWDFGSWKCKNKEDDKDTNKVIVSCDWSGNNEQGDEESAQSLPRELGDNEQTLEEHS
ncbi:hypothetical protein [Mycoplasma suis]|uniref:Uncharacterized protein n=1 Tax=Mycoplasma suis (strain Illinois) TaxID=768700 RepID=F0QQN6_MYCSL|nr:hypothetical protein [Mycoplasma suis]ADX97806.1 hypothetical protein MSU_0262 [Mycoplasma suis str. Illinois]